MDHRLVSVSRSFSLASVALLILAVSPAIPFASAEGTDELMPTVGGTGRLGLFDTEVFVDILDPSSEEICVVGSDSTGATRTVDVFDPADASIVTAFVTDGSCVDLSGRAAGRYKITNFSGSFTSTRRWDISVCDTSGARPCSADAAHPQHIDGRVSAERWIFNSTNTQSQPRAVQASVYVRVPIGSFGTGVVELSLNGVHGLARWELLANGIGVDGVNPSRSVRAAGRMVTASYPIYLNLPDPLVEPYGVPDPQITGFSFAAGGAGAACGVIEPGRNTGTFDFTVNMPGRYRLICDLNDDGEFDAAGVDDFVLNGTAMMGMNTLDWDGRTADGDAVPAGSYECLVQLNAGEFHYVAEDIEVAFPGLRMFQVNPGLTRVPLPMFWNDASIVPDTPITMPNGELPANNSPSGGLSSGAYTDAASANSTVSEGNARGWGAFAESGSVTGSRGDMNLIDTFTGLETVQSDTVAIILVGEGADCDGTGGTDFEEICVSMTDPCACDRDADCTDGNECTMDSCDEGDCAFLAMPRGAECTGGFCNGDGDMPTCVECLEDDDCPGDALCGDDNRCRGDDDDMDGIINGVECPMGLDLCPDTDGDGTPNYLDADDDNDSIPTRDERPGFVNQDTDGDMMPNHLDDDDDNDTIPTRTEVEDAATHGDDVDMDGMVNWLDTDSDNADEPDMVEQRGDEDGDGVPDYLDPREEDVTPPTPPTPPAPGPGEDFGGLGGGALCQASAIGAGQGGKRAVLMILLTFIALGLRKHRA